MGRLNSFFQTPIGQHGRHILVKNLKHSWTKWNRDINLGLQIRTPEWVCQVCNELQPKAIDPFLFPMTDTEFLRICPKCEHIKIENNINTYEILIIICRRKCVDT